MRHFLFLIALLKLSFCYSQNYSLNDFEESTIPEVYSSDWYKLNNATDKEFVFSLDSLGNLKISKAKHKSYNEYSLPKGKLIAVDMGEFGGGLYYKPFDTSSVKKLFVNGKDIKSIDPDFFGGLMVPERNTINKVIKNAYLITSGTFKFIFSFNDSIYLLSGLAHGGMTFGNLSKFRYNNADSIYISNRLNINDSPEAIAFYRNNIYMATAKGFYVIDKNINQEKLFDNLFWYGLYPTSVVVLNQENIYVTFRGGYVKINGIKKELKFYKAIK